MSAWNVYCPKCGFATRSAWGALDCACPKKKPTQIAMEVANGEFVATPMGHYNGDKGGVKHDQGKPDMTLMPTEAMLEIAAVWTFGQKKYAAFNWAKGFAWRRPAAAALRHIFAWLAGEDKDPESGYSHLAHAICCLCMLIVFQKKGTGTDDRHK